MALLRATPGALLRTCCSLVVALAVLACATGSDTPGGGGHNLPSAGLGPWLLPEEPEIFKRDDASLSHPWAHAGHVWYTVTPAEGGSHIARAVIETDDRGAVSMTETNAQALVASQPWEGDGVSQPSVIEHDGTLLMAYVGTAGVGLASGGVDAWSSDGLVAEGAWSSPSLVSDGERLLLFAIKDEAVHVMEKTPSTDFNEQGDTIIADVTHGATCHADVSALNRMIFRCYVAKTVGISVWSSFSLTGFQPAMPDPLYEDAGFGASDPMAYDGWLFYSRHKQKNVSSLGTGIAVAYLNAAPTARD